MTKRNNDADAFHKLERRSGPFRALSTILYIIWKTNIISSNCILLITQ